MVEMVTHCIKEADPTERDGVSTFYIRLLSPSFELTRVWETLRRCLTSTSRNMQFRTTLPGQSWKRRHFRGHRPGQGFAFEGSKVKKYVIDTNALISFVTDRNLEQQVS